MAKKRTNLQPWLDYFTMLQRYEQKGFLQMNPKEHEAYVTRAALLTLSPTPSLPEGEGDAANGKAIHDTVTRLRAYAAWREAAMAEANSSLFTLHSSFKTPFAVHIVKEDYPHDLLLTLLLQQKRSWRTAWRTVDTIEVIDYTEKGNPT